MNYDRVNIARVGRFNEKETDIILDKSNTDNE